MIHLCVKNYCQRCLQFTPNVEKPTQLFSDGTVADQTDTIIRCKNEETCENIKQYIERECKNDGF